MDDTKNAFWQFAESPLTWGGIGVVVGTALVSPAWFKLTFVGGGVSIAVALLRAGLSANKPSIFRAATITILLACFGGGWWLLWKVIPKPERPFSRQDALELLREENADHQSTQSATARDDRSIPMTGAEFIRFLLQYGLVKKGIDIADQDPYPSLTDGQVLDSAEYMIRELSRIQGNYSMYSQSLRTLPKEQWGDMVLIGDIAEETGQYLKYQPEIMRLVKSMCYRMSLPIPQPEPPSFLPDDKGFHFRDVQSDKSYLESLVHTFRSRKLLR